VIYEYGSVSPDGGWRPAVYPASARAGNRPDLAAPIPLDAYEDAMESEQSPPHQHRRQPSPRDVEDAEAVKALELVELYRSANADLKRRIEECGADRVAQLESEIKKRDVLVERLKDELRLEARRVRGDADP
jgi:hypothetical protein